MINTENWDKDNPDLEITTVETPTEEYAVALRIQGREALGFSLTSRSKRANFVILATLVMTLIILLSGEMIEVYDYFQGG